MSETGPKLDLERIVFIGRSFDEYMRMFDLEPEDLSNRRILDCPAGACSFTAKSNLLGADVTAADIAYFYPPDVLSEKGLQDIGHAMQQLDQVKDNFVWEYFNSIEDLREARIEALADSTRDRNSTPGRYIPVTLPGLPFRDQEFDLTLSAHFLFMYGDRLDYDFHVQTLQELLRVTKEEVRIFPIVDLSSRRYEHLDQLIELVTAKGWNVEIVEVPYEFQKGANHMLRIHRTTNL